MTKTFIRCRECGDAFLKEEKKCLNPNCIKSEYNES